MKHPIYLSTAIALSASVVSSFAGITSYSDRAVFEAALSGLNPSYVRTDEDLNQFTTDQDFDPSPLALNGFSIEGFGGASSVTNIVDTSGFVASGKQDLDGTSYIRGSHFQTTPGRGYVITFDDATVAWGADFSDTENSTTNLLLSDGTTLDLPVLGANNSSFIGFISDTPIFDMTSVGGGVGGDAVGFDNLITVAVPETSHFSFLISLVVSTAVFTNRRKAH